MLIVLDNAESILDPRGTSWQEINSVVEELSLIDNICLCITSRITTVPPDCEVLEIPTLSMQGARDAFYRIYKHGGQSDSVDDILEQPDFHPLSVTLLATVAHQNRWDNNRLEREWKQRQTGVLQIGPSRSLASTIELSLASPMFRELGPDAPGLLEIVAFLPQGIDENNLDWLFPTIQNRTAIFDTLCVLSLTYRSNGFTTMLAPLRDHLRPKDPMSSPLLCTTKDRYFARMSVGINPNLPVFTESQWITFEDVNVEHILDVLTFIDPNADEVWEACADFLTHLRFHKPRHTILREKIEGLAEDHRSKPRCLYDLAKMFYSIGNYVETKRLLTYALKLLRERGDESLVARVLRELSNANRMLCLYEEGIQQAKEALEIYQQAGTTVGQARCLNSLALLLFDNRLDAAKEAVSHLIDLLPEKGQEYLTCKSQRLLGNIFLFKGEREKAIHHLESALAIASHFNWNRLPFWIHNDLAVLFLNERGFNNAHTHIEQAKSHAINDVHNLGRAMELHAQIWYKQGRLKRAKSEALRASGIYEKLGASNDLEYCRTLLQEIEHGMKSRSSSGNSGSNGKLLGWVIFHIFVDSPFLAHGTPSKTFSSSRFSRLFKQK